MIRNFFAYCALALGGIFNPAILPPATTFAEGQQALMVKMLSRAGIGASAIVVGLSVFLGYLIIADTAPNLRELCVYGLLGVGVFYGLINIVVALSFSVGGPVGRLDLEATRNGLKAGVSKNEGHDEPPAA